MTIQADIQQLDSGAIVTLFVLDATALGGTIYYFHDGTNELKSSVVWQGVTYAAIPVQADGFEYNGSGKFPRPTLRLQNVDGLVGVIVDASQDLIGAKVTRKRTFAKYLDAVNFPGGTNPSADPAAAFPDDVYYVNRKTSHSKFSVEFELASSLDVHHVLLPRRQIIKYICAWTYRSAECGYVGGAVADYNDVPTTDLAQDVCGKRLSSCKMRFGSNADLPFGGFPGVGIGSL